MTYTSSLEELTNIEFTRLDKPEGTEKFLRDLVTDSSGVLFGFAVTTGVVEAVLNMPAILSRGTLKMHYLADASASVGTVGTANSYLSRFLRSATMIGGLTITNLIYWGATGHNFSGILSHDFLKQAFESLLMYSAGGFVGYSLETSKFMKKYSDSFDFDVYTFDKTEVDEFKDGRFRQLEYHSPGIRSWTTFVRSYSGRTNEGKVIYKLSGTVNGTPESIQSTHNSLQNDFERWKSVGRIVNYYLSDVRSFKNDAASNVVQFSTKRNEPGFLAKLAQREITPRKNVVI